MDHAGTRRIIDFGRPLAVLLVAVVHFIGDDDDPPAIIATLRDAAPPGSYLVISHVTGDIRPESSSRATLHYNEDHSRGDAAEQG